MCSGSIQPAGAPRSPRLRVLPQPGKPAAPQAGGYAGRQLRRPAAPQAGSSAGRQLRRPAVRQSAAHRPAARQPAAGSPHRHPLSRSPGGAREAISTAVICNAYNPYPHPFRPRYCPTQRDVRAAMGGT
jgi:hypothetical protein